MTVDDADIVDQAIGWHLRQKDMDADEWRQFTLWISADPAHAEAFDRIVLDDGLLDLRHDAPLSPIAANDPEPVVRTRRRWAWPATGLAAAAAAAACVAYLGPSMLPHASEPYEVATRPGQRRQLALADGTRIEVSGGTTLWLDRAKPRLAELREGEATFHVRHEASDPFTLRSGGLTVRDMGTVFNVTRVGKRLSVEVAEGSVLFQPDRESVTLKPGSALITVDGTNRVTLLRVAIETVGGWRDGRLSFTGAAVGDVAGAVERHAGIPIALPSTLAAKPFTGTIRLTGTADRDIAHLAALVGARARRAGRGWVLDTVENAAP